MEPHALPKRVQGMRIGTFGTRGLAGAAIILLAAACTSTPSGNATGHHSSRQSHVASPAPKGTTTTSPTSTTSSTTTTSTTTSTSTTTTTTTPPRTNLPAVPAGFVPESFTAVSTTHWWLLGHVTCGTDLCPALVTTTNGGASFERLPAPGGPYSSSPSATPPLSGIRFANPQDGWAYGAALYATHDGGQQWAKLSLPGTVTDLEPGLDEVFAVVTPNPPCDRTGTCSSSTPKPELWRTQPSSNSWQPDLGAGPVSGSLAVHGESVWVENAMFTKDGWALGTRLLYSADDGTHFIVEPQLIPGVSCDYQPVSGTDIWAYCGGGHFMFPYLSTDAGSRFAAVGTEASPTTSPVGCPNGSLLVAASGAVAVAACNVPPGSPLLRTDDGGSKWTAVQAGLNADGVWAPIGFTTSLVGYAFWQQTSSGQAQLWRTTTGGATWYRVTAIP